MCYLLGRNLSEASTESFPLELLDAKLLIYSPSPFIYILNIIWDFVGRRRIIERRYSLQFVASRGDSTRFIRLTRYIERENDRCFSTANSQLRFKWRCPKSHCQKSENNTLSWRIEHKTTRVQNKLQQVQTQPISFILNVKPIHFEITFFSASSRNFHSSF